MSSPPAPSPPNSNLQRSLQYYQKGVLQPEAWFQIVEQDYTQLIAAINWEELFPHDRKEFQVVDIGCGTGRFPHMLRSHLSPTLRIHYDYLDPSAYCLTTCQKALTPPFLARYGWQTTLEHSQKMLTPGLYDLAWAIQSLYCLEPANVRTALTRLIQALHPSRGTACLVLAKREAFFPQIHQIFFEHCAEQTPPPYLSAESVVAALGELGAMSVIRELPCTHSISIREDRLLEQYLQQSVMDTLPLPKWRQHPRLRAFLESHRQDDIYQFPNPYWLILSVPPSAGAAGKQRLHTYLSSVTPSPRAK
ncbi:MAG: class I SAM-dependent methyltransferase [Nitrospirota bacterium]|nr:class I SAM-dependent methyltransferase [Nitrospirota bacterium]MDH5586903.1 class I SAM-dependent methyltransferase [Nitrospirota bacterium]MDH5773938.1 class I SAM-dependent methyltransferase [Nitrospirota bacterium]